MLFVNNNKFVPWHRISRFLKAGCDLESIFPVQLRKGRADPGDPGLAQEIDLLLPEGIQKKRSSFNVCEQFMQSTVRALRPAAYGSPLGPQ
jgi:hypothetical protein